MRTATIKVLTALQQKKKSGITFDNFRVGFRLGAYIFDLRERGYKIITQKEAMGNGGFKARYFLLGEAK
jgi:hypothetical protein